jgi:hypothetical protein
MAIGTVDQLVAGMAARAPFPYQKANTTPKGANLWVSHFLSAGLPGAGTAPATLNGSLCDNTTAGSLLQANPASANLYLAGAALATSAIAGLVVVEDRIWHNLMNMNLATAQAITSPAFGARDANGAVSGVGYELWWECYTATAATTSTIVVTYTNSAGASNRTTSSVTINASATVGQRYLLPLAAGDVGVQSIQSVILGTAVATGTGGLVVGRRLSSVNVSAVVGPNLDWNDIGLPRVYNGACLTTAFLPISATATPLTGQLRLAEG